MGKSNERQTAVAGYSLDPKVKENIKTCAKEFGVSASSLVNYIMHRTLLAMSTVKVIPREDKYKICAATNQTIMHPGEGMHRYSIVTDLEFEERDV